MDKNIVRYAYHSLCRSCESCRRYVEGENNGQQVRSAICAKNITMKPEVIITECSEYKKKEGYEENPEYVIVSEEKPKRDWRMILGAVGIISAFVCLWIWMVLL